MFENYLQMSDEEKARVKALHKALRADTQLGARYRNLAWGFIRGFKYRRIERSHRLQMLAPGAYSLKEIPYVHTEEGVLYEHNFPCPSRLLKALVTYIPELAQYRSKTGFYGALVPGNPIEAWLSDRSGAIPAPVRMPKEKAA